MISAFAFQTNEKGQVVTKTSLLKQMEDLIEEPGLTCCICREGYKFQVGYRQNRGQDKWMLQPSLVHLPCFDLSPFFHLSCCSHPKPWGFTRSQSACSWRISRTSPGSSRATALCRTLTLSITTATWLLSGRARPPLMLDAVSILPSRQPLCFPLAGWLGGGRNGTALCSRMLTPSAMGCFLSGGRTSQNQPLLPA